MTTIMSVRRISASEPDRELIAARAAGWRRVDLDWERLQEAAHRAYVAGEIQAAASAWRRAGRIARWRFPKDDPRRAASLANLGFALRLERREAEARRCYAKARSLWRGVGTWIERLHIAPRARSSLFHLRMEARHRDAYHANLRKRLSAFADEAAAALAALETGRTVAFRLYGRWRAEKPGVFDDTRKLLAAALLIAAPDARES